MTAASPAVQPRFSISSLLRPHKALNLREKKRKTVYHRKVTTPSTVFLLFSPLFSTLRTIATMANGKSGFNSFFQDYWPSGATLQAASESQRPEHIRHRQNSPSKKPSPLQRCNRLSVESPGLRSTKSRLSPPAFAMVADTGCGLFPTLFSGLSGARGCLVVWATNTSRRATSRSAVCLLAATTPCFSVLMAELLLLLATLIPATGSVAAAGVRVPAMNLGEEAGFF